MNDLPISLSVKLTAQNSSPHTLTVLAFALQEGTWDSVGQPTVGQMVQPGFTGCWLAITTVSPGAVQGSMQFCVAQAGTLEVTWDLDPAEPFVPVCTNKLTDPTLAAGLYVNQGNFTNVWVQLILSFVTTALKGETLQDIADRFGTTLGALLYVNHFTSNARLTEGQRVLVASQPLVGNGPLDCD